MHIHAVIYFLALKTLSLRAVIKCLPNCVPVFFENNYACFPCFREHRTLSLFKRIYSSINWTQSVRLCLKPNRLYTQSIGICVYWTLASLTRRCYYKIYYWDKAFTWCRRHRTKERGKQWKQQVCEAVFYIKKKLKFSADWWSIPRRPGSRERICKLQKLIKIINKSKDGWQVKAQYECNDLAGVRPWEWKTA